MPVLPGLGTLLNAVTIIIGGLLGAALGDRLPARFQQTLSAVCAVAVLLIGVVGTVTSMVSAGDDGALASAGTLTLVLSLLIGALIGEALNIHGAIERLGTWLRRRATSRSRAGAVGTSTPGPGSTSAATSTTAADARFITGFVTASVTVCAGAMGIVGAIEDGMSANPSVLVLKSVLDLFVILTMATSMGIGTAFAALPLLVFQGALTALAFLIAPLMTPTTLTAISVTGSALIVCVGITLLAPGRIRVANLVPAIVVAPLIAPLVALTPLG